MMRAAGLLLAAAATFIAAAGPGAAQAPAPATKEAAVEATVDAAQPPLRIVTTGTSLTARGGWQDALRDRTQACLQRPVEVLTVARSGATSDWGLTQLDEIGGLKPDVILVEFYVNDAALHRFVSQSHSRRNIDGILDGLRQRAPSARIILMGMNPMRGKSWLVRPFLADYMREHRDAGTERGLEFIDFGPDWAALSPEALAAAIPDGAHPRPEVAAAIIAPKAAAAIAGNTCGKTRF